MAASVGLAFLAGILSILSPCVLPLLPVVLGTAASEHRLGPAALAAGLAVSFTAVGLLVATVGFAAGLDAGAFRTAAALLLVVAGTVLLVPVLQARLALAAAPVGGWAEARFGGSPRHGIGGQLGVGLLLGAVWSPCVGPTLGAATVLAARGESLGTVGATMLAFGLGAAMPLLALGFASRRALLAWRGRMAAAGRAGKAALGAVLAATGVAILAGADKRLEAALLDAAPAWLAGLATSL